MTNARANNESPRTRNLLVAAALAAFVGIAAFSGDRGTPAVVEASTVASATPMTGEVLSALHASIPGGANREEPAEAVPTF